MQSAIENEFGLIEEEESMQEDSGNSTIIRGGDGNNTSKDGSKDDNTEQKNYGGKDINIKIIDNENEELKEEIKIGT